MNAILMADEVTRALQEYFEASPVIQVTWPDDDGTLEVHYPDFMKSNPRHYKITVEVIEP